MNNHSYNINCNCLDCYLTRHEKVADDGEDGCFINYSDLVEKTKHGGLVSNSASYDKHRELNLHMNDAKIRQFDTGGVRDSDEEKFDIEGFLNPLVLNRYFEYMHKHRNLPNGKKRDSDNWQSFFGVNHNDVCIKSLLRHVQDLWLHHRGYSKVTKEIIEDSICAIIFNANAYLLKILTDKKNEIN